MRCVEELGWGAIRGGYDPEEVAFHKKRIGDRALVVGYDSYKIMLNEYQRLCGQELGVK